MCGNAVYIRAGENQEERCYRAGVIHRTLMAMPLDSPMRVAGELPEKTELRFIIVWLQFINARHHELMPSGVGYTKLLNEIVTQGDLPREHTMGFADFDEEAAEQIAWDFADWQMADA